MRRYPEYKESGIDRFGEIPGHWNITRLKYVSNIPVTYGLNIESDRYTTEGIRFVRITDIDERGGLQQKGVYLSENAVPHNQMLNKYDLLLSRSGSTVGKSYLHLQDGKFASAGYLVRFNFGDYYTSQFIYYVTLSQLYRDWLEQQVIIATIKNVNGTKYSNFEIPFPSHLEQTQIVNFLDHKTGQIDELIRAKERKIKLLGEYRASLINQAVTKGLDPKMEMKPSGAEWIGEIPKAWNTVPLTKYLESIIDYRGRTPEKTESGRFLVTAKNVKNGQLDYQISREFTSEPEYQKIMTRGIPQMGDVLFTTEAPLGQVANVDDPSIALAQRIIKLRPKSDLLNPYFLKYWLLSPSFQSDLQRYATGSTVLGIKASKLCLLKLNLPPLKNQAQIANFLDHKTKQIDELRSSEEQTITLLKEYRQSLISTVVTGKIDVRDEV